MSKNMSNRDFMEIVRKALSREFERQGFAFDRDRSQYIQYCFGDYTSAK